MIEIYCPACGASMVLRKGPFNFFYGCSRYPACKETHSAHQATYKPLGIPANQETRKLRIQVHEQFDKLWKSGGMKRNDAYNWLAEKMDLSRAECHIGRFDKENCEKALKLFGGEYDGEATSGSATQVST